MAIAFVGETANPTTTLTGTSATTQTCTRTLTAGNAVIAFVMGIGSASSVTFTDGVNTWVTDTTVTPLGGGFQCLATGHALNVAGGSTTVTATWNATVHHSFVILVEVSGAKTASALEGIAGQYQGSAGTGTDALTSGNPSPAPTTTANTFVCGFTCNFNNNVAPTAVGTGFTQTGAVKYTASMGGVQGEYKITSATGTYPATFTSGVTSDNWTTCVVILAEAPAGSSPPAPPTEPYPRRRPIGYPRVSDFTIPPSASVFTGTGFPAPERAVRAPRWLPPPRIEALPPMAAAAPTPPPPETPRTLPLRPRLPAANGDALPPAAIAPPPPPPEALRALPWRARRPPAPDLQMAPFPGPVPVVGLRLWLRGDLGITLSGPNVVGWADQSGNGNNVTNVGTVPYAASSINGLPGVTFTGSTWLSNTTSNVLPTNSPRTTFVVCRASSTAGGPLFQFRTAVPNQYTFFLCGGGYPTYGIVAGTDGVIGVFYSSTPTVNGATFIAEATSAVADGPIAVKLNGAAQTLSGNPFVAQDSAATGFLVGGWSQPGSQQYVGDICEVLVYDSVLSAGDEAAVYAYLFARYFPAPWVQFDAPAVVRRSARRPPLSPDVLPPLSAAAPTPPPPEPIRALLRRAPAASAYQPATPPPPPVSPPAPPPPAPLIVRAFRRVRQWIFEVGWPAVVTPPPGPTLPPPFTTVVDPVRLTAWVDSVQLTVAVDPVRLSLGERLKPRKTTDTYPITNTLLSNGVAVNLTGYTVTINIVERGSRNPKRANGACTLTDAANGKVSYAVVSGDVDTAGSYDVEWKAVSGGGVPYHFPQDGYEPLEIQPALG